MRPPTVTLDDRIVARNNEERTLLAHVRGWCHDRHACPMCARDTRILELDQALTWMLNG